MAAARAMFSSGQIAAVGDHRAHAEAEREEGLAEGGVDDLHVEQLRSPASGSRRARVSAPGSVSARTISATSSMSSAGMSALVMRSMPSLTPPSNDRGRDGQDDEGQADAERRVGDEVPKNSPVASGLPATAPVAGEVDVGDGPAGDDRVEGQDADTRKDAQRPPVSHQGCPA
jgi:hypothetical protein